MKSLVLLTLLAIVILVKSNPETVDKILSQFENGPKKELFKVYHFLFKKDYDLNSEEGLRRYKIFKDNLAYIKQVNAESHPYTLGFTPFTDMTNQEYRESMTATPDDFFKNRILREVNFDNEADKEIEKQTISGPTGPIDWRSYLGDVRDQGKKCLACYAFCAATVLEAGYAIKTGKKGVPLSPQQIIDCSTQDQGCKGGHPARSLLYTSENGLCTEAEYPYKGTVSKCKQKSKCPVINSRQFDFCSNCTKDKWLSLLGQGPISVQIDSSSPKFQNYKGGILDLSLPCIKKDHGVVVVGFSDEVITARNSWGPNWGEGGHFRMKYIQQNNSCFMTEEAVLPLF